MNAQQLKNAILQEAIEGRLVPQDPNDEPASALLARIRKEKEQLVKAGKLKKKDLEVKPISEDEIPFEIPDSWEWCRLSDVACFFNGDRSKNYPNKNEYVSQGVAWINTGHIEQNGYLTTSHMNYITEEKYNSLSSGKIEKGDLVYCLRGATFGKVAKVDPYEKGAVASSLMIIRLLNINIRDYIFTYLKSSFSKEQLLKFANGAAQPNLAAKDVSKYLLPLPPLAEQHRIVAKIEELLPKVEGYGKAQDALNKLNAELPERLKKSILQEAISGRLVPQDPNDEPASVLLAKIRKEKEQLVKEGKLKKKDLIETPITDDEIPFEIPESWEWVRLGNLVSNQTGLSYNKGDLEKKVDNPIRVLRGGNIQNGSWCTKVDDVMIAPEYVKKPNLTLQKNTFITPAVTSLEHLGKTALIEENHSDIVAGGFVLYLLPFYRDDILSKYLSCYFQSACYNTYCQSIANKSGQAFWNLSRQKLMEHLLPIPPLAEQKRIVEKLEQVLGEIDKLKK
jgi:type I restriction enzyme S subunit